MQEPRSFASHLKVIIDNSWLIKSTSRNYHHFFPVAFIRKRFPTMGYWEYNHILNITIVDDYLNKRVIRDRAPSDYMGDIAKANDNLLETLSTHLIGLPDDVGITDDNYETFRLTRANWVSQILTERLIAQETGRETQVNID